MKIHKYIPSFVRVNMCWAAHYLLTELDKKSSIPNQVHDNFDENLLKLFICNKCQEGFESGQELVAHVTLVHEEKAISESELNGLVENKTVESLQNELEELESKNDKSEMLSSPILKQSSKGNVGLVHEEKKLKHQCEICQHNFKFKAALNKHMKIVHGTSRNTPRVSACMCHK